MREDTLARVGKKKVPQRLPFAKDEYDCEEDKSLTFHDWLQSNRQICFLVILCILLSFATIILFKAAQVNHVDHVHILTSSFQDPTTFQRLHFLPTPKPAIVEEVVYVPFPGCLTELPSPDHRKHIVAPPAGPVTIVCCNSTKGVLTLEIHPTWAPNGAKRFLDMVRDNFFCTQVPMFRALKGFLIQFGLAGDPAVHKRYHSYGNLKDDPPWLPFGPTGREINGVKRYQKGYLGYAGAGKNSRGTQLIVALEDNLYLGGGSPWEVPFGQVVGEESFHTLAQFYTGYGEKPSQGKIMNRGAAYVREEFPLLDFITECKIVKENVSWNYQWPGI
jgi:cyclophilin family peptidyl-prolyl cis-trans isomerase